jgi:hypothetical protein
MYNKHVLFIIKLTSVCLLATQLVIGARGFYFLGDTNNYIEHALQGNLLTTFLWHHPIWPPLTAMMWNVLFRIQGVVLGLKLYLFLTTMVTWFAIYKVSKLLDFPKPFQMMVPTILMFAGSHHLLWQSALSEPLLLCMWWLSVYFLLQFRHSLNLRWLCAVTVSLATLPLIRYLGITLSLSAWAIVFATSLRKLDTTKIMVILQSIALSLVPISYYLLRNKIQQGQFVPTMDGAEIATPLISTIIIGGIHVLTQIWWGVVISYVAGWLIPWKKTFVWLGWLLFFSTTAYLVSLALSMNQYAIYAYLPARYAGVIFPNILLISLMVGSWSRRYFNWVNYELTQQIVLILISGVFINVCILRWNYHNQERINSFNNLDETAYSADLLRECPDVVIIHPYSRNWVVQSFSWLCDSTVVNIDDRLVTLHKNELIASPYDISIIGKPKWQLYAGKEFRVYKSTTDQLIDLTSAAAERDYLE